jgi:hypothetical protein
VQYANMSFHESQLKSIAKKTGARYFGVRDAKGLSTALAEIDQLEKTSLIVRCFSATVNFSRRFFCPACC